MRPNQTRIELQVRRGIYDECEIKATSEAVILPGSLLAFYDKTLSHSFDYNRETQQLDEHVKYLDQKSGQATPNFVETVLTRQFDRIKVEEGTPYERWKIINETQTEEDVTYTNPTFDISNFTPAVVLENGLLGKSINYRQRNKDWALVRQLISGDLYLLRAVPGEYKSGDRVYATQTENGIYVSTVGEGMFIGWVQENYLITEDMADISKIEDKSTREWSDPNQIAKPLGSDYHPNPAYLSDDPDAYPRNVPYSILVNLIRVRIGKASSVKQEAPITGVTVTGYEGTYDGQSHGVTVEGTQNGDTVTYNGSETAPTFTNSGTNSVTVQVTRAGYRPFSQTVQVKINPVHLSITGTEVAPKDYDKVANNVVFSNNGTLSGDIAQSDTVGFTVSGVYTSHNVPSGAVTATYTLTGNDNGNYVLDTTTASLSGVINPKEVTYTAVVEDKVYDGKTNATLDASSGLSGVISGDTVNASATATFPSANAGEYNNIPVEVTLSGAQAGNYSLPSTQITASATINKVQLTARASVNDKEWDGTTTVPSEKLQVVIRGYVNQEESSLLVIPSAEFPSANVGGPYTFDVTFAFDTENYGDAYKNYIVPAPVSVTASITEKETSVVFDGATLTYDGSNHSIAVDPNSLPDGATVTYTREADSSSTPLEYKDAGTYEITATITAPGISTITKTATLTIEKIQLTISGTKTRTRDYDGTTDVHIIIGTVNGIVRTETVSVRGTGAFTDNANVGINKPVRVTYDLYPTTDYSKNYLAPVLETITGTIEAKDLTIGEPTISATRDTHGDPVVTVTRASTFNGKVGNDDVDVTLDSSWGVDPNNENHILITYTYGVTGADAGNYNAPTGGTAERTIGDFFTYNVTANGSATEGSEETTDALTLSFTGNPGAFPASSITFPDSPNIQLTDSSATLTPDANNEVTVPVTILGSASGSGTDAIKVKIEGVTGVDTSVHQNIDVFIVMAYWGIYPSYLSYHSTGNPPFSRIAPTADQILGMSGKHRLMGTLESREIAGDPGKYAVACAFCLDCADWDVEAQNNEEWFDNRDIPADKRDCATNGGGMEFFYTIWDIDTSKTAILNAAEIDMATAFRTRTLVIKGVTYVGHVSGNPDDPDCVQEFTFKFSK